MIVDLIASLRQFAADKTADPKYTDSDLRRIIARAIMQLPQLQTPRDGQYIRSRDHVPIFFDRPDDFINATNVTFDGHLHLTDENQDGSVDRVIDRNELRAEFGDLLFIYLETKEKGGDTDPLTLDFSLDGGTTFLVEDEFETELAKAEYLDVSSYSKRGLTIRFKLAAGSRLVDSAQLYLLFLKQKYLLDYGSSVEWAASSIIAKDLAQEAMEKGYDITVINGLLISSEELFRRATGRTSKGEPLEKPQGADPGLGFKSSHLGGTGRTGSDRTAIEDTPYGRSVSRVFG